MLEQDGMRRRGRSIINNESNAATRISLDNEHETEKNMTKKNAKLPRIMVFIRFMRSNGLVVLLLVSLGIWLGVWFVRPETFSRYVND